MKIITMTDLRTRIEQKKLAIGWVDGEEATESLRNPGTRRSPAKRKILAQIEARAKSAGKKPVASYY